MKYSPFRWVVDALYVCVAAIALSQASACSGSEGYCNSYLMGIAFFANESLIEESLTRFGPTTPTGNVPPETPVSTPERILLIEFASTINELWVDVWLPEPIEGVAEQTRVIVSPPFPPPCTSTTIVWHADLATGIRHRIAVRDLYAPGNEAMLTRWLTDEEVEAAGGRIYLAGE